MTLRASDWKAIKNYAETYHCKPQLSLVSMGQFIFLNERGDEVHVGLQTMRDLLKRQKQEDKQS
jgi:hypothetical protein